MLKRNHEVHPQRALLSANDFLFGSTGRKWFLSLVDQAIVSGAGFLGGVIVGRTCAQEQFGLYLLGISIIGLIMEFQNVIIWSPYTFFCSQFVGSAQARYTGSTVIHQLALSGLSMLTLLGAGSYLSLSLGPSGLDRVVWILVLTISFITFREYARRVCFAKLRMKAAIALDSLAAGLQIFSLLLLAYLGKLSAASAMAAMGIAFGLAAIFWLMGVRKTMMFSMPQAVADLGRNWSFGRWILGGNIAIYLSIQLYPWILTVFHGTAAVGVLAACQGVAFMAVPFLQGTASFLGPHSSQAFAQGGPTQLRDFVMKSTLVIVPIIALFGVVLLTYGEQLVAIVYGSRYAGQGLVVSVLALYILSWALAFSIDYGIWAMGRPDVNFKINLLRVALTFTLGLYLVKTFGLLGVAWSLLIGSIAVSALQFLFFRRLVSATSPASR